MKRLSRPQWRMLRNVKRGLSPNAHCRTQSEHGGADGTFRSLIRYGLLTGGGTLTKKGRAALLAHENSLRKVLR
jgi:hypothetical protein